MSSITTRKKQRYNQLKELKRPFERMYTLIARYIDMKDVSFSNNTAKSTSNIIPEELNNNDVSHISDSASSALLGALWPNGAGSFRIERHRSIKDTKGVQKLFKEIINPVMLDVMDNHENGLLLGLEEAISELLNYGVASVFVKDNSDNTSKPVTYSCWNVKDNFIDEDEDKFIDTIYRLKRMDVRTVVNKYGLENVSTKVKRAYMDGKYEDDVVVMITIEPRSDFSKALKGNKSMRFETIHFEYDTNKILKEGGFVEFPAPTARYKKKPDEVWGRGSGGHSLPEVIELNAIWEALTIAFEKFLDPPLGMIDDGIMGGGDVDTSSGALTVFRAERGTVGSNVIFPLVQTGEPSSSIMLTEKLTQSISQHYMLDRLLDLNNQTEMTLGEANIRNSLRSDSLRKVYARSTAELFIPIITRTFNILFRKGYFGVIPNSELEMEMILEGREYTYLPNEIIEAIEQDRDFFEIVFISPAARMLQEEESNGIISILRLASEVGGEFPEALDSFDVDAMVRRLSSILGISIEVLNSADTVQQIREIRAQANAHTAQIEQQREVSEINRNNAQAQATVNNGYPK